MRILDQYGDASDPIVAAHVALPPSRPSDRAFVRLNMIASVHGGWNLEHGFVDEDGFLFLRYGHRQD